MDVLETRFAQNGDVHLAYQVVGSGAVDLLLVDDWVHHVEMAWEFPEFAHFLRRLGTFARVIHFDRRGTGCRIQSRSKPSPIWRPRSRTPIAVLNAVGSERPAVLGIQVGCLIAMLLAAPGRSQTVDQASLFARQPARQLAKPRELEAFTDDLPAYRQRTVTTGTGSAMPFNTTGCGMS